jgi:glycosyltransferase involved in cell wall biosynthesis
VRPGPLVSVILATYNWTSVLRYAIRSVLWQTFTDWELLVVGDDCTDDTAEVVASFKDPRIRWHNLPENTGSQSGPNNAGLAMAVGKYVAYMHQDDLWLPDHLAVLVDALEKGDAVLAHTLALEVGPPPELGRWISGLPDGSGEVTLITPVVMHRTNRAREVGGWRDWRTVYEQPQTDFFRRLLGRRTEPLTLGELTVVKFHSAHRPNSYVERRADEQAAYFARIQLEPDFRYRELLAAVYTMARRQRPREFVQRPEILSPGWEVAQFRRLRGLEQKAPPPGLWWSGRLRPALIRPLVRLRNLVPLRLRRPLGHLIAEIGEFVARSQVPTPAARRRAGDGLSPLGSPRGPLRAPDPQGHPSEQPFRQSDRPGSS